MRIHQPRLTQMPYHSIFSILMLRMPKRNLIQTIPKHQLVEARRKNRSRYVDKKRDPPIGHVRECIGAKKYCGDKTTSEISGKIGTDRYICETPYHDTVGQTDDERSDVGRDEGIGWIEDGPDGEALEKLVVDF